MNIYIPNMAEGTRIPMTVTHPRHLVPVSPGAAAAEGGASSGNTFADKMLRALDQVSGDQQFASALEQEALVNPDGVDPHDITIAQAKAKMSLDISRTVLNRVVQGWRDILNTR